MYSELIERIERIESKIDRILELIEEKLDNEIKELDMASERMKRAIKYLLKACYRSFL